MPTVRVDMVMEAIAKKLSGIDGVPILEQARMIKRAAKAGRDAVHKERDEELAELEELVSSWDALESLSKATDISHEWLDTLNLCRGDLQALIDKRIR